MVRARMVAVLMLAAAVTIGTAGCTAATVDRAAVPSPTASASESVTVTTPAPITRSAAPTPITAASTATSVPAPVSTTRVGFTGSHLPDGFPLPPGARVTNAVTGGSGTSATIVLRTAVTPVALGRSLTAAGYRVAGVHDDGGLGEVLFAGHGCAAGSQVAVTGRSLAVQCLAG